MSQVKLETSAGDIIIELFEKEAPITVANFLEYIDAGHYNGTVFHRVIDNFMIQGGGFDTEFKQKPTRPTIKNEADNRIGNQCGTLAMARTSEVHSASSQFFINVKDNDFLNFQDHTPRGYGYCVFGRVVGGMDVVNKIKGVPTGNYQGHGDVPREQVVIKNALRVPDAE